MCSMGENGELLEFGRPPLPPRVRLLALIAAGLGISALVVVSLWPDAPSKGPSSATSPTTPSIVQPTSRAQRWPTAPAACGSETDLPIVSSTSVLDPTGIEVLLGGSGLRAVEFDSGRTTPLGDLGLAADEFVVELATGSQTYAVTGSCVTSRGGRGAPGLVRIDRDGGTTAVPMPSSVDFVILDGTHAWGVDWPDDPNASTILVPADGGGPVHLPAGFTPAAISDGVVVGILRSDTTPAPNSIDNGTILLVDAATGGIRGDLGPGQPVAIGHGIVLWTVGCDVTENKPCTLRSRSIAGNLTASYALPRPPGFSAGLVSPDGRLLGFALERAEQDPQYDDSHPLPPTDIAVLHLDSGRLEIVPGIEIPAKLSPGLTFTSDSRWLVMALNAGTNIRLLAWRPGLVAPYESPPVAGLVWGRPSIVAKAVG